MVVLQCECSIDCLSTYYSSSITIQYSKVAVQHSMYTQNTLQYYSSSITIQYSKVAAQHSLHRIHYSTVACPNFKLERQHPPFKSTIVFLGLLIIYMLNIIFITYFSTYISVSSIAVKNRNPQSWYIQSVCIKDKSHFSIFG